MDVIRIGIAGAGRMGQSIKQAIAAADDVSLSRMWVRGEPIDEVLVDSDVLVDFSLPEANNEVLEAVSRSNTPLVCGVSGLDSAQLSAMQQAAGNVAIVFDRNMSQGIAVLDDLVRRAAASLSPDFAVEIHETHHVHKLDSPSGTALKLGESIAASRADENALPVRYEVERRGEVPGDHAIILSSATETLTLQHSVTTRDVFAEGALRAARWVVDQPPGLYGMRDVLFADT